MKHLTFLLAVLCLSAVCCFGQPLSIDEELIQFRNNIKSLQSRMDALQERYQALGTKIDNKKNQSDDFKNLHFKSIPEIPHLGNSDEQTGRQTHEVTTVLDNGAPVEYSKLWSNSLRFSYAICIPHDTDYGSYNLEYDTGHSIGLSYNRNYDLLFWGLNIGAKFFENKKLTNLPAWLPPSFQSILSNPKGKNYSTNLSALAGLKHNLTDKLYVQGNLGVGINYSNNEIIIGSNKLELNDTNFYGSLDFGFGAQLSEYLQLVLFYKLDGHGSSGKLENQLFSQFGLSLGMNY